MIIRTAEEKMDIHFRHIDIDYSGFVDTLTHGAHIARFIRQNVRQGIPLKIFTEHLSGLHYLNIASNDQSLMFFTDDWCHYQVNDVYYRHKCVVDLPHYNNFMHYAKEIIKDVTFSYYLINGDDTYHQIVNNIENDEFFVKELIVKSIDSEFGISVNYTDKLFTVDFLNYDLSITMGISNENELLNFQLIRIDELKKQKKSKPFYNFHDFVCYINKRIYKSMVEERLNIQVNEFSIQHREIVKMFDI